MGLDMTLKVATWVRSELELVLDATRCVFIECKTPPRDRAAFMWPMATSKQFTSALKGEALIAKLQQFATDHVKAADSEAHLLKKRTKIAL